MAGAGEEGRSEPAPGRALRGRARALRQARVARAHGRGAQRAPAAGGDPRPRGRDRLPHPWAARDGEDTLPGRGRQAARRERGARAGQRGEQPRRRQPRRAARRSRRPGAPARSPRARLAQRRGPHARRAPREDPRAPAREAMDTRGRRAAAQGASPVRAGSDRSPRAPRGLRRGGAADARRPRAAQERGDPPARAPPHRVRDRGRRRRGAAAQDALRPRGARRGDPGHRSHRARGALARGARDDGG